WRYFLVELITGLLFVAVALTSIYLWQALLSYMIVMLLVAIGLYDYDHHLIPHELVWPFNLLALGLLFLPNGTAFQFPQVIDLLAGPILASFFWIIWLISRGAWMGFADGTLALGIGWVLGLQKGITALLFSFWIGALISLLLLAWVKLASRSEKLSFKSEVPFGPFIIC